MKKVFKRIALILFIFLVLLIGILVAIPFLFKDRIIEIAKTEINNNVRAEVDFADVNLSFFRSFPDLSLGLEDFSVVGVDEFAGIPLASGKEAGFTVDVMSLINSDGPVNIKSVSLVEPRLNIQVLPDGTANYDIAIASDEPVEADTTTTDLTGLEIALRRYSIEGAQLVYNDQSLDMYVAAENFNHSGVGNFTLDIYDLDTETSIDALTVRYDGITYLDAAQLALDAIFNINMPESKYTLRDNALTVNALHLAADGFVQLLEEDINMDLTFSTPDSDFRALWSLIPNAYTADYASVDIQGDFQLA
ncbi:MAG: AsmA family protein, partial [Lewinella sp.]|nr:AsmA family protein [Lewinella sp.]